MIPCVIATLFLADQLHVDMAEMQIIVYIWSNSWCCSLVWIYQQCSLITLRVRNWWLPGLIPQQKYLLGSQGVCFCQSLLLHPCFPLFLISFSISQSTSLQGRNLWQSEPVTQLAQVTFSKVLFYLYLYWKNGKAKLLLQTTGELSGGLGNFPYTRSLEGKHRALYSETLWLKMVYSDMSYNHFFLFSSMRVKNTNHQRILITTRAIISMWHSLPAQVACVLCLPLRSYGRTGKRKTKVILWLSKNKSLAADFIVINTSQLPSPHIPHSHCCAPQQIRTQGISYELLLFQMGGGWTEKL